jgi:hypothetical protein
MRSVSSNRFEMRDATHCQGVPITRKRKGAVVVNAGCGAGAPFERAALSGGTGKPVG